MDENVGKVLDALDRLKLAENTVVVYASDNGFYLGEHTLADKRSGYDESLRIPLLVRYPKSGLKGVTRDDMVLNIDLAPTFLDLAGVAGPEGRCTARAGSRCWRRTPPKEPFRTSFFYEYFREDGAKKAAAPAVGGYNTPTMTAVRTRDAQAARSTATTRSGPNCSTWPPTRTRRRTCSPTRSTPRSGRSWRRSTTGWRRSSATRSRTPCRRSPGAVHAAHTDRGQPVRHTLAAVAVLFAAGAALRRRPEAERPVHRGGRPQARARLLRRPAREDAEHRPARRPRDRVHPGVLPAGGVQPVAVVAADRPPAGHARRSTTSSRTSARPCPTWSTLPQHFKHNGYYVARASARSTTGGYDDEPSWSVPWEATKGRNFGPDGQKLLAELKAKAKAGRAGRDAGPRPAGRGARRGRRLPQRRLDREPRRSRSSRRARTEAEPFFLAVGFAKPHLPFVAPKKYWDLYDPAKLPVAESADPPKDAPTFAPQFGGELRRTTTSRRPARSRTTTARKLVHGYYAAVSYMDAQVGRVLDALEEHGLRDNTVVVLWGDHGWHLGDHGMWCKHTNYEKATRAALRDERAGPEGRRQDRRDALVEFVDIYPTLAELCGLPQPDGVEGHSFAPLLDDPKRPWKAAAFSQYPRGGKDTGPLMGYAIAHRPLPVRRVAEAGRRRGRRPRAVRPPDRPGRGQERRRRPGEPGRGRAARRSDSRPGGRATPHPGEVRTGTGWRVRLPGRPSPALGRCHQPSAGRAARCTAFRAVKDLARTAAGTSGFGYLSIRPAAAAVLIGRHLVLDQAGSEGRVASRS